MGTAVAIENILIDVLLCLRLNDDHHRLALPLLRKRPGYCYRKRRKKIRLEVWPDCWHVLTVHSVGCRPLTWRLVLVIVGAFWRQVDYANKLSMPWRELRDGPASAGKTLLLDYVTPIWSTSLWMAIKNRHWPVILSIVGQILIIGAVCIVILWSYGPRVLTTE